MAHWMPYQLCLWPYLRFTKRRMKQRLPPLLSFLGVNIEAHTLTSALIYSCGITTIVMTGQLKNCSNRKNNNIYMFMTKCCVLEANNPTGPTLS